MKHNHPGKCTRVHFNQNQTCEVWQHPYTQACLSFRGQNEQNYLSCGLGRGALEGCCKRLLGQRVPSCERWSLWKTEQRGSCWKPHTLCVTKMQKEEKSWVRHFKHSQQILYHQVSWPSWIIQREGRVKRKWCRVLCSVTASYGWLRC